MAALLAAVLIAGTLPARAQMGGGFAGSSLGLPAGGVPSNPFASNYPSAPPPAVARPRPRDPAQARRSRRSVPAPGSLRR